MKFQKSFFHYSTDNDLVGELVHFFTKAEWTTGVSSKSLIIGVKEFRVESIESPRSVNHIGQCDSISSATALIRETSELEGLQDFILVDLRDLVSSKDGLDRFLLNQSSFCCALRSSLKADRYGCLLISLPWTGGSGFPYPWAVAAATRGHLRLRDEKVGLISSEDKVFYVIVVQANDETRFFEKLTTKSFSHVDNTKARPIPGWVMPRSPPRKKREILHPGKFPETLIEQFIKLFTAENDTVFDPMVGTGSTLIAALRTQRNAIGVDLSDQFIQIARDRIKQEQEPALFPIAKTNADVFLGDSTRLHEIGELDGLVFDYVVTSPPYWSMLKNSGSENQQRRREQSLPLTYSNDVSDIGNILDYDEFLGVLERTYVDVAARIVTGGILTVIVKNIKKQHTLYPLAWDLAAKLCKANGCLKYVGTTLWCQDNVGLKPFAIGTHWVSNILHTYCLHFEVSR